MSQEVTQRLFGRPDVLSAGRVLLPTFPLEVATAADITQVRDFYRKHAVRGIIKLDVDRHLNDYKTGESTDNRIFQTIQDAIEEKWLVCLSSRRPGPMLRKQQVKFGTNGPNDAEFGAIVDFPMFNFQFVFDEKTLIHYQNMREGIATNLVPELQRRGYSIDFRGFTDQEPDTYIERRIKEGSWENTDLTHALWLNLRRMCGLTVFSFEKKSDSKVEVGNDPKFFSLVQNLLQNLDISLDDGIRSSFPPTADKPVHIIHSDKTNKTYAWRALLQFLGEDFCRGKRFYHLGDGEDDAIGDDRVIVLSPSNGVPEVKQRAQRVSQFAVTEGVVDNLHAVLFGQV